MVFEPDSHRPGGENPLLGDLCREIGEVEYSYIQSFKTLRQDFAYRIQEPGIEGSLEKLSAWYRELDNVPANLARIWSLNFRARSITL